MAVKIFFCYAHEDEALLNKLKSHLRPLQRQGLIDIWHDRDISAGTEWKQEIAEHLNSAQIILLLISPDFMNSDYCWSVELKRALERHTARDALVIPVILRPVHWQGTPFGELQALPKDGKAVTTWANRDGVLADVVEQIGEVIQQLTRNTSSNGVRDQNVGAEKSGLTFARIAIDTENKYWCEADKSQRGDFYNRQYVQHFYLSEFVSNVDPSFDITLLNTTTKPVILTDVGIEIVSVAQTPPIPYGFPKAVKVEMATSYTINMPDIWSKIEDWRDIHGIPPIDLNEVVSAHIPDPIYLQAKAPYRYKLLLHHYRGHMPNGTILRMWIRTNQSQERSHEIYISTL